MEVWRDKCLKGSLRVARPGELARKIIDIVADDQDMEPQSVVHTHLCILLAEGDDLELKRPRMASTTPRTSTSDDAPDAFLSNGNGVNGNRDSLPRLTASKSVSHLDTQGITDLTSARTTLDGAGILTASGRTAGGMTLEVRTVAQCLVSMTELTPRRSRKPTLPSSPPPPTRRGQYVDKTLRILSNRWLVG